MRQGKGSLYFSIALAVLCVWLLPDRASADNLTGNVTVEWFYPTASSPYDGPLTIAAGSSYTCTYPSGFCSPLGFSGAGQSFLISPLAITYTGSGFPSGLNFNTATFNGFDFSGLTFASGGSLAGYTLATNTFGLTPSDISFTSSSIEVNLAGLPGNGTFTLDLIPTSATPTPEPSSLLLLGTGLMGLMAMSGFARLRKQVST